MSRTYRAWVWSASYTKTEEIAKCGASSPWTLALLYCPPVTVFSTRRAAWRRSIAINVATRQRYTRLQMLTAPCLSSVDLTSQIISQSLLATRTAAAFPASSAVVLKHSTTSHQHRDFIEILDDRRNGVWDASVLSSDLRVTTKRCSKGSNEAKACVLCTWAAECLSVAEMALDNLEFFPLSPI